MSAVFDARAGPVDLVPLLMNMPDCVSEVIVVGDISIADVPALAHSTNALVRIVTYEGSTSKAAFACGFAAAEGEIVVMLDNDSDLSQLERFVSALEEGANFASGTTKRAQDTTPSRAET